eukprot:m.228023 g.228023  ORF g.228023 m.228023 type:complete len:223 (+) comp17382_c0_seq1:31-699(+)
MSAEKPLRAIVIGATGAVGHHITGILLGNPNFSKVTTIGRKPLTLSEEYASVANSPKLEQKTVDFENLTRESFEGHDVVFCALGTTRKDAGSAEAFRRIDFTYVDRAAQQCHEAGVKYFAYVSSQGASASSWFLYPQVKGQVEDAIKAKGFPTVAIARPGLLDRGAASRAVERFAMFFMSGIPVRTVAAGLVQHCVENHSRPGTTTLFNAELKEAAARMTTV